MFRRLFSKYKLFLAIPFIRKKVVHLRFFYFVKIKKQLKTIQSEDAFDVTVDHNLRGIRTCIDRMDLLIKPLAVLETLNVYSKILVIGPRNENDLLSLL